MKTFEEFINEKSLKKLYHWTRIDRIEDILKSGLKVDMPFAATITGDNFKHIYGVNPLFCFTDKTYFGDTTFGDILLEINCEKISIRPDFSGLCEHGFNINKDETKFIYNEKNWKDVHTEPKEWKEKMIKKTNAFIKKYNIKEFDVDKLLNKNTEQYKLAIELTGEENGYDGIQIHDFAQVESEGNFGHKSIGLFKNTIPDLNVDILRNVEHPNEKDFEEMNRTRDWESKEYKNYKK